MRLIAVAALALAAGAGAARATAPAPDVPILEYHVIGYHTAGSPLEGLYVTPEELARQVEWLAASGWRTVTLGEVASAWRSGRPLPARSVVLSFDDGYPGDWRYAMPILRRHGFVGVLNLQIGNLVPRHVRQLIAAGWEIDSHTFTHPDLRTASDAQLEREIVHSRRWLQTVFHIAVPAFCYPFGLYDARVVAAVQRAGYLLAETENQGWASPSEGLLTLDRLRVTPETGVAGVASLLRD
jgi:peptidoglycan/xylan/chitin deacetylase (PgdA/CDA1 family)